MKTSVHEELKDLFHEGVLVDEVSRRLYATDASIFQVQPLAVIVPRDEEEVAKALRFARERGIPIAGRGAGSGLAGESLTSGLVIDFSRHFRRIVQVGEDSVRVQPGVVYRALQEELARVGRRLGPDPASGAQCTIGGMVANNASGSRALRHGYTRDHVLSLRAVWDTGDADWVGREPRSLAPTPESRKRRIVAEAASLLEANAELIRTCRPRTRFNRCGYLLDDVLTAETFDLARLLVGTEGTLALFTEVELRTIPRPEDRCLVLFNFQTLERAAAAVAACLEGRPSALELLDRRLLSLTCETHPEYRRVVPSGTEAALLVEFEADRRGEVRKAAAELIERLTARFPDVIAHASTEAAEMDWLWQLRDYALPVLFSMPGGAAPVAYVEDVGVPVEELGLFLHRAQEILQAHQTTASFLVHAGAGQVHTRPFLDLTRTEDVARLRAIADQLHALALDLGGTVSTQHGVGLARTPWVGQQYGRLAQVFRDLKRIFDPQNILNPGKIVEQEADALREHLRRPAADPAGAVRQLRWSAGELTLQCHSCNGCGSCRTEAPGQRMCPLFRVHHTEAATPRAKANLLRALLAAGRLGVALDLDDVRSTADLCVNCKMCAVECPAHVNVPKLMLEAKALHVAERGLTREDWLLARGERLAALGSRVAWLANVLLQSKGVRWILERAFGLSRRRILPSLARPTFLERAARLGWTRPAAAKDGTRVAFFVGTFGNCFDPDLAEAAVAVLLHNEIPVTVPPGQVGSGLAPLAVGDVEAARDHAQRNLNVLADLARDGHTIVCLEPSSAITIRLDYANLLEDPDAQLVAANTVELSSFLGSLHRSGRLRPDLKALDFAVGHHVPCHVKALGPAAGPELLRLIPELRVETIDVSCSGMAGTFGLKEKNRLVSLAAGAPMLDRLKRESLLLGSSECSSCRMQMELGAGKRCLHPVQYLAAAYGILESRKRGRHEAGALFDPRRPG